MINKLKLSSFLLATALVSPTAMAAERTEMVVTGFKSGGATEVALDLINVDGVAALDFVINVPGINLKGMDLSGCATGLVSTHRGQCRIPPERKSCWQRRCRVSRVGGGNRRCRDQ